MIKLFRHLDIKERLMVFCGILFVMVQVWLELKMPEYMSKITVLIEMPGSEMSEILKNGGYMLACAVGSMIATIATGYFAAIVSASLSLKLRSKLFRKVMSFNEEEMTHFSTASLITRTTNDITQVQMLVAMGLQIITKTPIMLIWGILKIMGKEWQWSAATAAAVMLIVIVIMLAVFLALPKFKIIQELTDDLNRVTRENLTGIRVIRAYNAEKYQQKKFDGANSSLTESNLFALVLKFFFIQKFKYTGTGGNKQDRKLLSWGILELTRRPSSICLCDFMKLTAAVSVLTVFPSVK